MSGDAHPPRPPVDERPDRWRTCLLVALLLCLLVIAWEMVPATWHVVAAWRDDAALRAITRPLWFHLNPLALTAAELVLLAGTVGALAAPTPAASRRRYLGTFAAAMGLQIVPRLVPLAWSYSFPPELLEQGRAILTTAAPLDAIASALDLVPLLLAMTLGLLRAGAHEERLHPGRAVGPILVFTTSLQLMLLAVITLALVGPLQPDGWLPRGLLLLVTAYAVTAARQVLRTKGRPGALAPWLTLAIVLLLLLPGWTAVLCGLESIQIGGRHLLAIGGREGLVTLGELPGHSVHFVARACATAIAGHDLIVRVRAAASGSR